MNSPELVTYLSRRNYRKIAAAMLDSSVRSTHTVTFTELMRNFRSTHLPDAYALTAKSAIPVADAIRGYHDELGLSEPILTAVNANSATARSLDTKQADAIFMEACRIEAVVRGNTIALIDQFVGLGKTLELGRSMLRCAGARGIRSDENVRWYDQAEPADIDCVNLTSEHADFMHEIGEKAAKLQAVTR